MALVREIRFALRTLGKSLGFTSAVVCILGLGLGAAIAVVDLTNLLAWRTIPAERPNELVEIYTGRVRGFAGPWGFTSYPDYRDYREATKAFSHLAASREVELRLDTGEATRPGMVAAISGNYFSLLGLDATAGRLLGDDDDRPGAPPVVVLSHAFWQRLGADPQAVGSTIRIEKEPFSVVGIAPRELRSATVGTVLDAFLPATALDRVMPADPLDDRDFARFEMLGRLAPGVSRDAARAEMATLAARLDREYPLADDETRRVTTTEARLAHPIDLDRMEPSLRLFALAVALLLGLTCANVAHLLLARASARRSEMAVRRSLGASRGALVRQLLVENLMLALGGGALGLVLAWWGRAYLRAFAGPEFAAEMRFDLRVLAASFGICLVATLLFGLLPALAASRTDPRAALDPAGVDSRRRGGGGRRLAGSGLAGAQVALAVVLLAAGALLVTSLVQRLGEDRGFDDHDLLIARVELPEQDYSPEEGRSLFERIRERAEALPGVERAATTMLVPPTLFDITLPVRLPGETGAARDTRVNYVDPHFFETMRIPHLHGRSFTPADGADAPPVVIVNRRLAETLWPGEEPLGQSVEVSPSLPSDAGPLYTVVGVVGDVDQFRSSSGGEPVLYFSSPQRYRPYRQLVLRATGDPEPIFDDLRDALREIDSALALAETSTGETNRRFAFTFERMQTTAVGVFAVAGFLLALIGLFAVLGYDVARRAREIGIRMAVGARRVDIVRPIVGQGVRVAVVGSLVGLAALLFATPVLENLLSGIAVVDARVLIMVVFAVLIAAAGASYLPARRASRRDPLDALRHG